MSEKKLNQLEETLAHQEQQIHDLNDVVTRQWNEIDLLKKHITKMQDKIRVFEDTTPASENTDAALDKPPHY